jgi:hypothetical protein
MPPVSAGVACGRHGDDASATRAIRAPRGSDDVARISRLVFSKSI